MICSEIPLKPHAAQSIEKRRKFRFDSLREADLLLPNMENAAYQKLLSKGQIALGVILTLGVFIYMSIALVPFTFSPDPFWAQAQACFAAVPIATTFWFAINMFLIVLADQRKQKQALSKTRQFLSFKAASDADAAFLCANGPTPTSHDALNHPLERNDSNSASIRSWRIFSIRAPTTIATFIQTIHKARRQWQGNEVSPGVRKAAKTMMPTKTGRRTAFNLSVVNTLM